MDVLRYLAPWSAVGAAAFTALVIVAFRTGLVWQARGEDGLLKQHIPASGHVAVLPVPLELVALQVLANAASFALRPAKVGRLPLYLLNFVHYLVLCVYDTLVIDILVLSVGRPRFLRPPDAIGLRSMKRHAVLSLPFSASAGVALPAISTLVSYLAFLK